MTPPPPSSEAPRVVVTRARHQAAEMAAAFEAAGFAVEFLPLIEIAEPGDPASLERAAEEAGHYDWWVFTSANAVDAFLPRVRDPAGTGARIAVVGPATARAVRRCGVEPRIEAARATAEGLVDEMGDVDAGVRILVPQADDARPVLVDGLRARGARVTPVEAYAKRLPAGAAAKARELFEEREIGWVTFTSPRIVRHFVELFGASWNARRREVRALAIGPVTTRELRLQGVGEVHEAARPAPEAMARVLRDRLNP